MSKNKPTPKKATKKVTKKVKKPNGRKTWLKVAKKVHELNKKEELGWTWSESMRFASKKVYPNFKGKSASKIRLTDIESEFKASLSEEGKPTPKPIETCFSALNVPAEDLIEREWWSIADDDIWINFDDNLPMRFAFDSIIDTGIIKKSQMPNMMEIREDIRRSGIKYGLVIFKVLVQPNKKDDGKPCSYYILVTLENSSYDQSLKEGEIYGQITEEDLSEEQLQKREKRRLEREKLMKQKTSKKKAKERERPKEVEPRKSANQGNIELEKIKLEKSKAEALKAILDILRKDYNDGILTKRQYLQRQKQIIEKFENGGQI